MAKVVVFFIVDDNDQYILRNVVNDNGPYILRSEVNHMVANGLV